MTEREKLLRRIERFMRRHGLPDTTFGVLALNDTAFVARLRDPGKAVKSSTIDRINAFMAEYEPPAAPPRKAPRKGPRARRFQTTAAA